MLMPSIFGENLFDDWMDFPFGRDFDKEFFGKSNPLYGKNAANIMKTDVRDVDNGYEIDVDLPGFKKDEVKVSLENGYLTIQAAKGLDKDSQDKKGKYIRKERYSGQCSRSYYVGEQYRNEDIKARFEDGILKLAIPKRDQQELQGDKYIAIEG